jgi:hypothetical protein
MTKPQLTLVLLNKIVELYEDWEEEARYSMADEESHWDRVKHYRPIAAWAKHQISAREASAMAKRITKKFNGGGPTPEDLGAEPREPHEAHFPASEPYEHDGRDRHGMRHRDEDA